jgi:hypothetical protein
MRRRDARALIEARCIEAQEQSCRFQLWTMWHGLALIILLSIALGSEYAQASESVDPVAFAAARAIAYQAIPPEAQLDVMASDNSELATESADTVSVILKQKGFEIQRDSSLAVDVGVVLVRGIRQDEGPAPAGGAQQGAVRGDEYTNADRHPEDDPLTRGNLYSSEHGALLSPAHPSADGHVLRVSISVFDRKSGRYVWRGLAERDTVKVSVEASLQQMILALLNHFGETLPETKVPLY